MQTLEPSSIETQHVEVFRQLQSQLRDRWPTIELFDQSDADILVIPSLSVDQRELLKIPGCHHYEERLLFSLIRLQNPRTRLIYVTSQPIHPSVIDYYLQLLPGIPFSHARDRLLLLSTYDSSLKPLTQKILERPRLIQRIRQAIDLKNAYMICYNSSFLESELSVRVGVPLYACDPQLSIWGTKSGSRQIFAESGVPHPDGSGRVWNVQDLATEATKLWECKPELKRLVVKLNEGISGEANALLDLRPLHHLAPPNATHEQRIEAITQHFGAMSFQATSENWANFSTRIPELGAIVEEFIEGEVKRSPSVQGRITPSGEVEILSTHDQILGGPDGQIYLGCRFPADETYRMRLQELGIKVGKKLAEKGALERFGVDFIAVQQPNHNGGQHWDLQAIEINLRKGGTTHPFMTLKLLTNGRYHPATGIFYSPHGRPKYYIATDNLQKERYCGLLPSDLMDIIAYHRLHFDTGTETGTVFHLMGCLSEFGKLGLTSIGDSPQQAEEIYNKVVKILDEETRHNSNNHTWELDACGPIIWNGTT
ncbi:peptide ligase PGM1-related protein [Gloeocapsopsis dulcis]|uniref:Carboxylate-amine ligase n=1 Tax=Gloeocapsopsis dulcis AAB1 = 1H9 TaxID=1433147 RepID=A0A6N8FMZ1_9CHRO|nr:peptide ligase PGM1-related protein [Gloeocapsopsis dulcis]MUL34803.1 carboxylate-amine ligase [Gloeocapsopsis dulcis AAB1 = 1H9]WNN90129.1 peptide ligase PGM1-related protein [Gloeocapsopsis dulcis]